VQPSGNNITIIIVITLLFLSLATFIVGILLIYQKKQIAYQRHIINLKSEYEEALLKTQLEIQEQTFQSISQEIHDNISLSLTLVKLNLNTLDLENKSRTLNQIGLAIEFVSKAINDLSNVSRNLNSEIISEQGLIKALEKEIEKIRNLGWYSLNFKIVGVPTFMDSHKELVLFRIVQESFNNVLKHAHAKTIDLTLRYTSDQINIRICDDGIGFEFNRNNISQNKSGTAGLKNMRKRAELINGKFIIKSRPGAGTITRIIVPF
jgi:two-component system, NarL family, sensor kinase